MVHIRINEREPNPNKHINFVSALPAPGTPAPFSEEDARQLLRALAAQVRPIMKSHGFAVNSFEEYEYNRVFAGRNWNNGETVELVLRRADGTFVSIPWLLSTLCHELAHIKHMNHGRDFQRLWSQLRMEVRALQERGYFGDGYWSSGTRISDSLRAGGQGVEDYDLPEYVCGGAQTRPRPKSLSRRRRPGTTGSGSGPGPSNHTGAQVPKRRKPGARVKAKNAFKGEGKALNDGISDEEAKSKGTGFRKQAGSKRAREERALAAERRMKAIKSIPIKTEEPGPKPLADGDEESVTESDSEYDLHAFEPPETDETRRQTMRSSIRNSIAGEKEENEELLRSQQFMRDFLSKASRPGDNDSEESNVDLSEVFDAIEVSDSEDEDERDGKGICSIPSTSNPVNPKPPLPDPSTTSIDDDYLRPTKRPRKLSPPPSRTKSEFNATSQSARPGQKSKQSQSIGLGRIVQEEMSTRKKEALGLAGSGSGRKLGDKSQINRQLRRDDHSPSISSEIEDVNAHSGEQGTEWSCLVCTLNNQPAHLACSACGTPRGEDCWPHS